MADIVITAANVQPRGGKTTDGVAGATLTAGQIVYLDEVAGTYKLADSNGAAALRSPDGITLNSASAGQPIKVHKSGPIVIGGALTAGAAYYLSDTPGGLCPVADVGTGEYATIIGIATSTTVLDVDIQESGVAL